MAVYYNNVNRFLEKTITGDIAYEGMTPCLLWTGKLDKDGYGKFHIDGKAIRAHRYAYREWRGELLPNHVIMHRCDVPNCVNPEHLSQGTVKDNNRDMFRKGRNMNFRGEKNPMNKLNEYQVQKIRSFYAAGLSKSELARTFDVSPRQIYNIVNHLNWKKLDDKLDSQDATVVVSEYDPNRVPATAESN